MWTQVIRTRVREKADDAVCAAEIILKHDGNTNFCTSTRHSEQKYVSHKHRMAAEEELYEMQMDGAQGLVYTYSNKTMDVGFTHKIYTAHSQHTD